MPRGNTSRKPSVMCSAVGPRSAGDSYLPADLPPRAPPRAPPPVPKSSAVSAPWAAGRRRRNDAHLPSACECRWRVPRARTRRTNRRAHGRTRFGRRRENRPRRRSRRRRARRRRDRPWKTTCPPDPWGGGLAPWMPRYDSGRVGRDSSPYLGIKGRTESPICRGETEATLLDTAERDRCRQRASRHEHA